MSEPDITAEQIHAANADATEFFRRSLLGPDGPGPRDYLTDRGFGVLLDDTRWSVGYAPKGWTSLYEHMTALGYSDTALHAAGLIFTSKRGRPLDFFRDRIIFGVRDEAGKPTGFVGRKAPNGSPTAPKYLNTRSTVIYDKTSALFGLGELRSKGRDLTIISEGPLDAIAFDLACDASPHTLSMATCGTALSRRHATAISEFDSSTVVLAFDPDTAGSRALAAAYQLLPEIPRLLSWRPADALDPADHLAQRGSSSLRASLERGTRPAADAIIDHHFTTWPSTKTGAEADLCLLREALRSVRNLHVNDVARQVARIADRLGITCEDATRELLQSKPSGPAVTALFASRQHRAAVHACHR
ncbi:MAG: toprim domain-containing protein [Marmoricola sp.]|jgi:DNA primase